MSDFDPGPGWRELPPDGQMDETLDGRDLLSMGIYGGGSIHRWWARESPVPPLPTEPYTVIRVTWRDPEYLTGSHIYTLSSDRYWCPQNRHAEAERPDGLAALITGWEPLAEPRKVTAEAVLDRLPHLDATGAQLAEWAENIAREFGGES